MSCPSTFVNDMLAMEADALSASVKETLQDRTERTGEASLCIGELGIENNWSIPGPCILGYGPPEETAPPMYQNREEQHLDGMSCMINKCAKGGKSKFGDVDAVQPPERSNRQLQYPCFFPIRCEVNRRSKVNREGVGHREYSS